MTRAAVFLDRDGTLIHDREYLADPAGVELLPGAADAVKRLNAARVAVVVVTNQSGIARGMYSTADYERVRAKLDALLGAADARLDATYMCPHHPDFGGACECRKPGTLLFRQAAADLGLDLTRSFFVGDRLRDVSPARALGGTGILVPSPATPPAELTQARAEFTVCGSLDEAVSIALQSL